MKLRNKISPKGPQRSGSSSEDQKRSTEERKLGFVTYFIAENIVIVEPDDVITTKHLYYAAQLFGGEKVALGLRNRLACVC